MHCGSFVEQNVVPISACDSLYRFETLTGDKMDFPLFLFCRTLNNLERLYPIIKQHFIPGECIQ